MPADDPDARSPAPRSTPPPPPASGSRLLFGDAQGDTLTLANGDGPAGPDQAAVHAALRAFVGHRDYPCVGAKAAMTRGSYVFAVYGSMDRPGDARLSAADLAWFHEWAAAEEERFATFLAVFTEQADADETAYERRLWAFLQRVHEVDAREHEWDPRVSDDPADPHFRFSVGGGAFFVIGLGPHASRTARRFPFPALVFNRHDQFEALREAERFEAMRDTIRERETDLEGEPNPLLADHGSRSEAEQYAGRPHQESWTPPFESVDAEHADAADAKDAAHGNAAHERNATPKQGSRDAHRDRQ